MDNASIIATFPADLREEVMLTSSEAVLSILFPPLLAEAQLLRDRAMGHYQARSLFGSSHRLSGRRNGLGFDRQSVMNNGSEANAPSPGFSDLKKKDRMRRWLCCACQVEETFRLHENESLKSLEYQKKQSSNNELYKVPPPIEVFALPLDELKEKTDNFGSKSLIGEGSYGRVYFANLESGKGVAKKKLDTSTEPDSNSEFLTQVSMVSRLKHDNLVELLGYCVEGNVRVLTYEFAIMGSRHDILHGRKGVQGAQPGLVLDWM